LKNRRKKITLAVPDSLNSDFACEVYDKDFGDEDIFSLFLAKLVQGIHAGGGLQIRASEDIKGRI
jgi:hypothetical protein